MQDFCRQRQTEKREGKVLQSFRCFTCFNSCVAILKVSNCFFLFGCFFFFCRAPLGSLAGAGTPQPQVESAPFFIRQRNLQKAQQENFKKLGNKLDPKLRSTTLFRLFNPCSFTDLHKKVFSKELMKPHFEDIQLISAHIFWMP